MDIELPEDKGTYVLLAHLSQAKQLEIGRLGEFDLVPGFYAYVGSAHGSGGLRARIQHHLESTADPHWHTRCPSAALGTISPWMFWRCGRLPEAGLITDPRFSTGRRALPISYRNPHGRLSPRRSGVLDW